MEAYSDLRNLLQQADSINKLLIFEDFNARLGRDSKLWKGVLGRNKTDSCNDNMHLFLEFSSDHQLVITNSLFQQKDRTKAT